MKMRMLGLGALLFAVAMLGCSGSSGGTGTGSDAAADVVADVGIDTPRGDTAADLLPDTLPDTEAELAQPDLAVDTGLDTHLDLQPDGGPDTIVDTAVDAPADVCLPACEGKVCGDDGCGGSCGTCDEHFVCENGTCAYQPWCGDATCDVDLLEDCDACPGDCPCSCGETCNEGTCAFTACADKECGDDGCTGSCGECEEHFACEDGACVYQPWCGDATCEADILENCATCLADCLCDAPAVCFEGSCCVPDCEGMACGDDGCGGSCGTCPGEQDACVDGLCVCQPACDGKQCGADGCGGACGACPNGEACNAQFECATGTWYDQTTGLTWENPPLGPWAMYPDEGDIYCQNLAAGGYTDWRLPTINELRSLVSGCLATQPGGACGVTDVCFSCWNQACMGCPSLAGPTDGCYWPTEMLGECHCYITSTVNADNGQAWAVYFKTGRVDEVEGCNAGAAAKTRCAR